MVEVEVSQHVGGYPHGYMLTIGLSCRPSDAATWWSAWASSFCAQGMQGRGVGGGGGMPVLGRGVLVVVNSPSYPSQIFLLKLST